MEKKNEKQKGKNIAEQDDPTENDEDSTYTEEEDDDLFDLINELGEREDLEKKNLELKNENIQLIHKIITKINPQKIPDDQEIQNLYTEINGKNFKEIQNFKFKNNINEDFNKANDNQYILKINLEAHGQSKVNLDFDLRNINRILRGQILFIPKNCTILNIYEEDVNIIITNRKQLRKDYTIDELRELCDDEEMLDTIMIGADQISENNKTINELNTKKPDKPTQIITGKGQLYKNKPLNSQLKESIKLFTYDRDKEGNNKLPMDQKEKHEKKE